jgi:hypothetical protein
LTNAQRDKRPEERQPLGAGIHAFVFFVASRQVKDRAKRDITALRRESFGVQPVCPGRRCFCIAFLVSSSPTIQNPSRFISTYLRTRTLEYKSLFPVK